MALLVTSVFGVTGCGSDDDVDVESRVKNAAPEASGVSDGPSEADCDLDLLDLRDLLDMIDLYDRLDIIDLYNLRDIIDLLDLVDRLYEINNKRLDRLYSLDIIDLSDLRDRLDLDLRDQCDAASDGGADSVTTTTEPPTPATEPEPPAPADAPEGDDVDEG